MRTLIDSNDTRLSIRRQCQLIGLNRSTLYYQPATETPFNLALMEQIDRLYLERPSRGSRTITDLLQRKGYPVNRKRVQRLMRLIGIQAVYPRPKTSVADKTAQKWPYLLKNRIIQHPNEAWCVDITYVPMAKGFMYLVAIIDWHTRFVLSWELSNTMDTAFCLKALHRAFYYGQPAIFNSDQGAQFTSDAFIKTLTDRSIRVSMAGIGRCFDNIFIERLWRSVKYEEIYLYKHETVPALFQGLDRYFKEYCYERPHQSLAMCTPAEAYFGLKGLERPIYV